MARIRVGLRVGLTVSVVVHLAVLLFLLLGLPSLTPKEADEPPEATVAMVFQGTATAAMRAPVPADLPAPSTEIAPPAPPVTQPPQPQPAEAPPPPPPPRVVEPAPKVLPLGPTLPPDPQPTPAPVMPSPPPTPPVSPPPNPAKEPPPLPLPPPPVPPPPSPPSPTQQPNPTKNPAPNSRSVENTLDKLRQQLAQTQPPRARHNPRDGGQPNGGGNPLANDTAALSSSERGAIGDHVRECWTKDAGALDIDKQRVLLTVTTDAAGVARKADVTGEDIPRMGDPRFRAFAERAVRAVMDAHCATLPLPANVLGKVNVLTFRFSP